MKNLTSIEKIERIEQFPGVDALEIAYVRNLPAVINRGDYKAGDYILWISEGAQTPATPPFTGLKDLNYTVTGLDFGSVQAKGVILPLENFKDIIDTANPESQAGTDLSSHLGITPIASSAGQKESTTTDTNTDSHSHTKSSQTSPVQYQANNYTSVPDSGKSKIRKWLIIGGVGAVCFFGIIMCSRSPKVVQTKFTFKVVPTPPKKKENLLAKIAAKTEIPFNEIQPVMTVQDTARVRAFNEIKQFTARLDFLSAQSPDYTAGTEYVKNASGKSNIITIKAKDKILELHYERARAYLDYFVVQNPRANEADAEKGLQMAILEMEKAIDPKAPNPQYIFNLGQLYQTAGDTEKAIQLFKQATTLDKSFDEARFQIGFAFQQLGKDDEAGKYYDSISPSYYTLSAQANYYLGFYYFNKHTKEDYQKAIRHLQEVKSKNSSCYKCKLGLALAKNNIAPSGSRAWSEASYELAEFILDKPYSYNIDDVQLAEYKRVRKYALKYYGLMLAAYKGQKSQACEKFKLAENLGLKDDSEINGWKKIAGCK